jgi:hypothetical protein
VINIKCFIEAHQAEEFIVGMIRIRIIGFSHVTQAKASGRINEDHMLSSYLRRIEVGKTDRKFSLGSFTIKADCKFSKAMC